MLYSGLNHVNYLNIIKSDHVSATVTLKDGTKKIVTIKVTVK